MDNRLTKNASEEIQRRLKVFGCVAYVPNFYAHKTKFSPSPKAKIRVFVGYDDNSKGYRCFDPASRRFYISRHVTGNLWFKRAGAVPGSELGSWSVPVTEMMPGKNAVEEGVPIFRKSSDEGMRVPDEAPGSDVQCTEHPAPNPTSPTGGSSADDPRAEARMQHPPFPSFPITYQRRKHNPSRAEVPLETPSDVHNLKMFSRPCADLHEADTR